MEPKLWRHTAAPSVASLLEEELCTFSVLHRILKGSCDTIVTDRERLLAVLSALPFPVWVWMPDDASPEELERCWQTMLAQFPPSEGHSFNMKMAHAAYMLRRAEETKAVMHVTRRLYAYACEKLLPPRRRAAGSMVAAQAADLDVAALWVRAMHREVMDGEQTAEGCRGIAESAIKEKRIFLWKDEQGQPCAMCGVIRDGAMMSLSLVFTPPEKRRQGYAANLVHDVTKAILAQRLTPALYADADYAPSNACYTQIGYERRGELTTIAWKR